MEAGLNCAEKIHLSLNTVFGLLQSTAEQPSTHHRRSDVRLGNLKVLHREQILVHDDKVGLLADLKGSDSMLLERSESSTGGEATKGVEEGEPFGWEPWVGQRVSESS